MGFFFSYYNLNSEWLLFGWICLRFFSISKLLCLVLVLHRNLGLTCSSGGDVTALVLMMDSLGCVGLLTWLVSHAIVFGFVVSIVTAVLFFHAPMCTLK